MRICLGTGMVQVSIHLRWEGVGGYMALTRVARLGCCVNEGPRLLFRPRAYRGLNRAAASLGWSWKLSFGGGTCCFFGIICRFPSEEKERETVQLFTGRASRRMGRLVPREKIPSRRLVTSLLAEPVLLEAFDMRLEM